MDRPPLILVTSLEFWALSRTVLTDMFLTLTVVLAMFLAWKIISEGKSHLWLPFWVVLGLSMLIKGPVGQFIVLLTLFSYRFWQGPFVWRKFRFVPGLCAFGVVSLPWYFWSVAHNDGLLAYFLQFQTLERFATTTHGREGPLWYFIPVILLGFLPWTAMLWPAFRRAIERSDPESAKFLGVGASACGFRVTGSPGDWRRTVWSASRRRYTVASRVRVV